MDNTRYKIVLVDDNLATLSQGKSLLQAFYKVYTVQSAATLFENLEHDLPDLILLDVEMPGMDGFETIKVLKNNDRYKDIPIIFLTSKSDEESERLGFSLGAVDYITKPFSGPLLQKRISNQILYTHVQAAVKTYSDNLENMVDEIARANERTRILLDMTPLCTRLWDTDRKMIDCNEAAVKLFGFKDKQECLERYSELYPEFQPDGSRSDIKVNECIDKAFEEGRHEFEWTYKMLDGTLMPSEVILVRVEYEDGYAVAGYTRDLRQQKAIIEEIRRAEVAEESSKAKSRFLATMSHEIRTPMNSIIGFTELALDAQISGTSDQVKDYLVKIHESTKWLLHIVNDILDISKIESGKVELENVTFDLQDVYSRCQSVILPEISEKGLELVFDTEPLVGEKLIGDPVRLYQVFMNLLSNAAKFTSTGSINFTSIITKSTEDEKTIYFEIKDSGVGMTQKQVGKIFDPFIQADSSTTRNYGGTGLGLAITRSIVELMGGELKVESTPDVGSKFFFEITLKSSTEPDDSLDSNKLSQLPKPHFKGLVLVCDDNPMNQEVICEHLARVGLETIVAANGKISVEMVRKRQKKNLRPFDMIFMDMFMPLMDGIEAASEIMAIGTGTPVVAMTASIMVGDIEKYRKHGIPDCLGKPFTSQELWRVLLKYLTPVENVDINSAKHTGNDDDLQKMLKTKFVKNNQTRFEEISQAINTGDISLAHRLAHSLKTNADFIGMSGLTDAAAKMEQMLKDEALPISEDSLTSLKTELEQVLIDLQPLLEESDNTEAAAPLTGEQARDLFDKLEIMLECRDAECVNMLSDIRSIPGGLELAGQIENYDFKLAAQTLSKLRNTV